MWGQRRREVRGAVRGRRQGRGERHSTHDSTGTHTDSYRYRETDKGGGVRGKERRGREGAGLSIRHDY
jgi:hypothetical protein